MTVELVQAVRVLRGGSRPILCVGEDKNLYVLKLEQNPQGAEVLANELIAHRLATILGLPVPDLHTVKLRSPLSIEISELLKDYPDKVACREPWILEAGTHLASKYPIDPFKGNIYDSLTFVRDFRKLRNLDDVVGAMVFDVWLENHDRRQFVFWKTCRERRYRALLIDNGFCFAKDWKMCTSLYFEDLGKFWQGIDINYVRAQVCMWTERIMAISDEKMVGAVSNIPLGWHGENSRRPTDLLPYLFVRRSLLQELIKDINSDGRHKKRNLSDRILPRRDAEDRVAVGLNSGRGMHQSQKLGCAP